MTEERRDDEENTEDEGKDHHSELERTDECENKAIDKVKQSEDKHEAVGVFKEALRVIATHFFNLFKTRSQTQSQLLALFYSVGLYSYYQATSLSQILRIHPPHLPSFIESQ